MVTTTNRIGFSVLWLALSSATLFSQSSTVITTFAGPPLPVNGVQAIAQAIGDVASVIPDGAGGFYFASFEHHRIYRVNASGTLTVVAGTGAGGFSGDDGPAALAQLNNPTGLGLGPTGDLYIADTLNHRIRKVSAAGLIVTVAGTGTKGFGGDGGPATAAQLNIPTDVTLDAANDLFIADAQNHRIRKVNVDGVINTVAGSGTEGFSGDGGLALAAQLDNPVAVAVDAL